MLHLLKNFKYAAVPDSDTARVSPHSVPFLKSERTTRPAPSEKEAAVPSMTRYTNLRREGPSHRNGIAALVDPAVHDVHVVSHPILGHITRIQLVSADLQDPVIDYLRVKLHLA